MLPSITPFVTNTPGKNQAHMWNNVDCIVRSRSEGIAT